MVSRSQFSKGRAHAHAHARAHGDGHALPAGFVRAYSQVRLDAKAGGHGLRAWSLHADAALVGQWALTVQSATSAVHPEAPHCDLDGLEVLPRLLRFLGAGKALTTLTLRLYWLPIQ